MRYTTLQLSWAVVLPFCIIVDPDVVRREIAEIGSILKRLYH